MSFWRSRKAQALKKAFFVMVLILLTLGILGWAAYDKIVTPVKKMGINCMNEFAHCACFFTRPVDNMDSFCPEGAGKMGPTDICPPDIAKCHRSNYESLVDHSKKMAKKETDKTKKNRHYGTCCQLDMKNVDESRELWKESQASSVPK